ncbi:efflux RND transporter permease subunit [bacterium SCSIO 12741]|nr:efflux RND transporter permease subunit [bacterium SCSIO 12741]
MLAVPLGILGCAALQLIMGLDNNIYTQVALVMLIGLLAKNAILIVEFAKMKREEEGLPILEAVLEGAKQRFRPILMTAFSFILGTFPLLISTGAGAVSQNSVGSAVFGGMLTGTILGVFFTPVLFVVFQRLTEKFKSNSSTESPSES